MTDAQNQRIINDTSLLVHLHKPEVCFVPKVSFSSGFVAKHASNGQQPRARLLLENGVVPQSQTNDAGLVPLTGPAKQEWGFQWGALEQSYLKDIRAAVPRRLGRLKTVGFTSSRSPSTSLGKRDKHPDQRLATGSSRRSLLEGRHPSVEPSLERALVLYRKNEGKSLGIGYVAML